MKKTSDRKLSSLEMTVLGLAWLRGPCTTYAIMKELSLSASSYHKSRAGTAYSVAKRLLETGLLKHQSNHEEERLISITPAGVQALQQWLSDPVPAPDIAHSADLLRLRFFFLGAIDQKQRLAFIDQALDGLREFLHECESLLPENEKIGDYFGVLATLSTVLETRARIQWLTIVREWVLHPLPLEEGWAETVLASASKSF